MQAFEYSTNGGYFMRTAVAFLSLLLFTGAAYSQTNTSAMDGTVTDPQGALIARAEVTVS